MNLNCMINDQIDHALTKIPAILRPLLPKKMEKIKDSYPNVDFKDLGLAEGRAGVPACKGANGQCCLCCSDIKVTSVIMITMVWVI